MGITFKRSDYTEENGLKIKLNILMNIKETHTFAFDGQSLKCIQTCDVIL